LRQATETAIHIVLDTHTH